MRRQRRPQARRPSPCYYDDENPWETEDEEARTGIPSVIQIGLITVTPTGEECAFRQIGSVKGPWVALTLLAGEGPERLQQMLGPILSPLHVVKAVQLIVPPWWYSTEATEVEVTRVRRFHRTLSTWARQYQGVSTMPTTNRRAVQRLAHWMRISEAVTTTYETSPHEALNLVLLAYNGDLHRKLKKSSQFDNFEDDFHTSRTEKEGIESMSNLA